MRIPFDIKYRPQIESGKYRVETKAGCPVRIVCWDMACELPILGLVLLNDEKAEEMAVGFTNEGTNLLGEPLYDKLFIVTPEEEMTEWQRFISACLQKHGLLDCGAADRIAKESAAELLELARKQLIEEQYTSDPRKTDLYKLGKTEALRTRATELTENLVKSGLDKHSIPYHLIAFMCNLHTCQNWKEIEETAEAYATRIKAAALKDLPRWKKYNTPGASKGELSLILYSGVYEVGDIFIDKGLYIPISDLEKLQKDE